MKKELRDRLRSTLNTIEPADLLSRSADACRRLADTPEFNKCETLMVFLSMANEIDTTPLVLEAWQRRKRVLAPKVIWGDRRMIPLEIHSLHQGITESAFNIREPVGDEAVAIGEIDLLVVPGLGFDRLGHRLGRGAGFYDRFLAHRDYRATSCALGFDEQVLDELPVEPQDRRVDLLVTDRRVIRFTHAVRK